MGCECGAAHGIDQHHREWEIGCKSGDGNGEERENGDGIEEEIGRTNVREEDCEMIGGSVGEIEEGNEQQRDCDLDDPKCTRGYGVEGIHEIHDNECGRIEAESASCVDCSDLSRQSYARLVQNVRAVSCH